MEIYLKIRTATVDTCHLNATWYTVGTKCRVRIEFACRSQTRVQCICFYLSRNLHPYSILKTSSARLFWWEKKIQMDIFGYYSYDRKISPHFIISTSPKTVHMNSVRVRKTEWNMQDMTECSASSNWLNDLIQLNKAVVCGCMKQNV